MKGTIKGFQNELYKLKADILSLLSQQHRLRLRWLLPP